jgi:hypothetical protein
VVAQGGVISEPDEVTIVVGTGPAAAGVTNMAVARVATPAPAPAPAPASAPAPAPVAAMASTPTPEQILATGLAHLSDAAIVADHAADVFDSVAGRADLYTSFAELQEELKRRLDVVIPVDPAQRQSWTQTVFLPLTAYTTSQLAGLGLYPQWPQSLNQPLTPAQRQGVRGHMLTLAQAFRAASAADRAQR